MSKKNEVSEMESEILFQYSAVGRLAELATWDCGGSVAAATVLLNAWNDENPIRRLLGLDGDYRRYALAVIQGKLEHGFGGGQTIEDIVGTPLILRLAKDYGIRSSTRA